MNDELKDRMELLAIELRRQQKRHRRSLYHTIVFSVIILIFFSIYMYLISFKIREVVTPKTVALLIADELRFEEEKKSKYAHSELLAKDMARSLFSAVPMLGPMAAENLRRYLSAEAKEQTEKIGDTLTPFLHASIDRIVQNSELSEVQLKKEADIILKKADWREMHPGSVVLHTTPGFYANYLKTIRMKGINQLTRQEQNVRDFILCSLYFSHDNRYRDSSLSLFFENGTVVLRELDFIE